MIEEMILQLLQLQTVLHHSLFKKELNKNKQEKERKVEFYIYNERLKDSCRHVLPLSDEGSAFLPRRHRISPEFDLNVFFAHFPFQRPNRNPHKHNENSEKWKIVQKKGVGRMRMLLGRFYETK